MIFALTIDNIDAPAGLLDFQAACQAAEACQPAIDHIAASIDLGLTLRECMDQAPSALERKQWAQWCRYTLADRMDEEVRLAFSEIGTDGDERMAAQMCVERDDLGLNEAIVQLSRWHSAMRDDGQAVFPVIESELAGRSA